MAGDWLRRNQTGISHIRSAKARGIGVENLAPGTFRNADAIAMARDRRKIADCKNRRNPVLTEAEISQNRLIAVIGDCPGESARIEITLVQCRILTIDMVELPHAALNAAIRFVL
jgi:hypothetical protein